MRYPAKLTPDDNDTFLITFPDVPEAISFGTTREEALTHGLEALLTMLDVRMADRQAIPAPSPVKGASPFVTIPLIDEAKIALYQAMRDARVTKAELGRRLQVYSPQVDRLLKVRHNSHLEQLTAAFHAMGKDLELRVVDQAPPVVARRRAVRTKRTPARRSAARAARA